MNLSHSNPLRVAWLCVLGLFAVLVVAGCGSSSDSESSDEVTSIGKTEGALNLIAWAGYAEDGSTDKKVDWVSGFQDKTGCQVSTKTASTSDEMVKLMRTGQYDGVSASGDASVRLIEGGDVDAIDMSILSNYADVNPSLKDQPYNTIDGKNYGMPHGWGANVLLYNTDDVKPTPTSWGAVFDEKEAAKYSGKITAPDNPIYIADAAVYLKATQPDLGIDNPYELDEDQFNAAVDLLKEQNKNVGEYWPDATKNISSYTNGDSVIGSSWQYQTSALEAAGEPVSSELPDEGTTGWSDTWMLSSEAEHPNCMLEWMNWMASPETQAQVAEWFGEAPANLKACDMTTAKDHCKTYHADDTAYYDKIAFWQTPVSDCGDDRGEECKTYDDWVQAWTEIKG
jgi:putative spermidine/putrescine transport system substrate-binding protein